MSQESAAGLGGRLGFLLFFSIASITCLFMHQQAGQVVLGGNSKQPRGSLKLAVRDSLTGYRVPGEITSQVKNGRETLWTNAEGRGTYELSSGRNDLEIQAAGYHSLNTHFEPDSQSVKQVTLWVDPLEPPEELRPEVVTAHLRAGQAMLHGHVLDSETGQPLKGVRVRLEHSGVKSQTDDRGYFLLCRPVPPINSSEELPNPDNLVADLKGFKSYRRTHVIVAEGATHFIIDLSRGEGVVEKDDTHKLMLAPGQLNNTKSEIPDSVDQKLTLENVGTEAGVAQPLGLTVPTSIRVGSNCPSKSTCTTFNVYSLDTYVKNGLDDEWIASWHAESLKAGAIAYRSYGVYYVYHPLTANYDICNTTSCQVNDPADSSSRTNSATDNTTGIIVVDSSGNNPFFAEYAAENNDSSCPDGFTGSPSANWPCLSDSVDAGQTFNGHGRGMCQWGTQRWATNQGKDYVWIVNHYYNNDGNPSGARSGVLQIPSTPTPTPTPIQLIFDTSGPAVDQVAAQDSILFLRDPFPVVNGADWLNQGADRNTRVIVFVTSLQLAPGQPPSAVVVNLVDANSQSYDVAAEDVRPVPDFSFTQVTFRLPNNLAAGPCTIKIKAPGQVSNAGKITIRV